MAQDEPSGTIKEPENTVPGGICGMFYVLINALQARGAATESLIVNISRQGLIYVPAMLMLGSMFHETGLIWAQPVADVLSLALAVVLYLRKSKKESHI